jgi:putative ABC transport system ATP-binding protein
MNNSSMIQLENVVKRYQMGEVQVAALNGISLTIERGEFVSIMGSSGSGKSTLLQIIGLLDSPTTGSYNLEGNQVVRLPDAELARIRNSSFGFIFQAYNLFPELTALENVELPLTYAKVNSRQRRDRAMARLEAVGLSKRLKHYPSQLSGGEQQRVAIARALVNEPTLVLADEPTGNLSKEMGEEILSYLTELNHQGASLMIVTHDPDVGALAKRQIRLTDGQIVSDVKA